MSLLAHRLGLILVALIFGLITLGGVVHNTESSLACPDWPLCFGQVMPEMTGGVAIEHSHRLLATLVGMLTIGLAVLLHRSRKRDPMAARLGWLALGLVVGQGLLGGITVLFKLPTLVSTAHLATSMAFFALIIVLTFRSHPSFDPQARPTPWAARVLPWVTVTLAVVYAQMLLGALVRHTGSGAAVGLGPDSIVMGFDLNRGSKDLWPGDGPGRLHMAHRFAATLVLAIVLVTAHRVFYAARAAGNKVAQVLSVTSVLLLLAQVALGVASIWTFLSVPLVTAHLSVGAALFVDLLAIRIWLGAYSARVEPAALRPTAREAAAAAG